MRRSRGTPCPWPRRPRSRCPRPGPAITVLGEVAHRGFDDPLAAPSASAARWIRVPMAAGSNGKETRETSGSLGTEAPNHLQPLGLCCSKQPPLRRADLRTPTGSPCGFPYGPPPWAHLAAWPGGGAPSLFPLRVRPRPGPPLRPCGLPDRLAVDLAAFPESGTPVPPCGSPLPRPVPSRQLLRLLGARRNVSAAPTAVNLMFPQVRGYICRSEA